MFDYGDLVKIKDKNSPYYNYTGNVFAELNSEDYPNIVLVNMFNNNYAFHKEDLELISDEIENIEKKEERVDHPDHYLPGTYEAINVIEAWLGKKGCFNFCVANALKYLARIDKKKSIGMSKEDKTIEDIKKAIWYLEYSLKML